MRSLNILFLVIISSLTVSCIKDTPGPGSSGIRVYVPQQALLAANSNTLYAFTQAGLIQYDASLTALQTTAVTGSIPTTFIANQNYIYTSASSNFKIYDIANGTPTQHSTFTDFQGCAPVAINGNYLFITERHDYYCGSSFVQLKVVDMSNPDKPVTLKTYPMDAPYGIAVDGNNLFVCDKGLKYYDASNPANLVLKQTIPIAPTTLAAQNGKLAAAGPGGLYQFDYATGALVQISKLKLN